MPAIMKQTVSKLGVHLLLTIFLVAMVVVGELGAAVAQPDPATQAQDPTILTPPKPKKKKRKTRKSVGPNQAELERRRREKEFQEAQDRLRKKVKTEPTTKPEIAAALAAEEERKKQEAAKKASDEALRKQKEEQQRKQMEAVRSLASGMPGGSGNYAGPDSDENNKGMACNDSGEAQKQCACTKGQRVSKAVADQAIVKATSYYKSHRSCIDGGGVADADVRIAVNDYNDKVGCMYIVDIEGRCVYSTSSSYGQNSGVPPEPGCQSGSKMTPAGFHVTVPHSGGKYNASNSFGMQELQGQGSRGRGILIHQGSCNGANTTWGCAGVGNFEEVKRNLGHRSLVYNDFGGRVGNCSGALVDECKGGGPARIDPNTGMKAPDVEGDPEVTVPMPNPRPAGQRR